MLENVYLCIPPGTKPGNILVLVNSEQDNKKIAKIPLNLTVWGFELPEKISMQSHVGSFNAASAKMMGVERGSEEFLELEDLYNKMLLKHRASPSTPESIWPEWDTVEGIIDRGESKRLKELVEVDKANSLDIPLKFYKEDKNKSRHI